VDGRSRGRPAGLAGRSGAGAALAARPRDAGRDLLGVPVPGTAARADRAAARGAARPSRPVPVADRRSGPGVPGRRGRAAARAACCPVPGARAVPVPRAGARDAACRGRHAHRMRPVGLLPAGQRGDRAGARGRGVRRDHPARAGLLRGALPALWPDGRGGPVRAADHRDIRGRGGGRDRRQLGRVRVGDEGVRAAVRGHRLGVPGRRALGPGPRPRGVPRRTGTGRAQEPGAGQGGLPRRLPPRARPAHHPPAARPAPRDPRPGTPGTARCGRLLRLGRGVQPAPAGGRTRARLAEGGLGARERRVPRHLRQPGVHAADLGRTRQPRPAGRHRAHRRGAGRVDPRRAAARRPAARGHGWLTGPGP
jgi:hypothetical protein